MVGIFMAMVVFCAIMKFVYRKIRAHIRSPPQLLRRRALCRRPPPPLPPQPRLAAPTLRQTGLIAQEELEKRLALLSAC